MKQVLISEELLRQAIDAYDSLLPTLPGLQDNGSRWLRNRLIKATDDLRAALEQPAVEPVAWLPMDAAPKDGTLVRLLVNFDDHATEDGPGPHPTIGSNTSENDEGPDEWQFAEWNWEHDYYTQGVGTPVGWLPMVAPQPAQQLEVALRKVMSRIAELLDEDQFAEIENIVLGAGVAPQAQQPVHPRHPVVVRWRNEGIEACAGIADASRDMRAMIIEQPHKAEPAPQTIKQEPVLLLDEVIDAITDTIWGKQKVTSMYPTYRMYARTVEAATLLNQVSNKQG